MPRPCFLAVGLLALTFACGNSSNRDGSGGSSGSDGMTQTGGVSGSGGSSAAGGTLSSGGIPGSGGSIATGGVTSSGSTTSSGGSRATGGATGSGETTPTGGSTTTGGAPGTGGRSNTGGTTTTSSGGSSTGNTAGASGTMTGGRTATGGATATGGTDATGGTEATGGRKATGGSTSTGGAAGTGGSGHAGAWQIMPLGDSITGTTCYPKLLSQELLSKGRSNFTFVGTVLNNQSCGSAPNVQTEGHGGYLVTYLTTDDPPQTGKGTLTELKSWAAEKPEVVLMEYGTNDAWSSIATSAILDAYGFVVDEFRAQKSNVIFFVAQITPLNPSGCPSCEADVEALNAAIPDWASGKSTLASPIHVVDVWASLPAATYTPNSTYTSDGCHPNAEGSQLMADAWDEALTAQGIP
jgi:lysophospholipase L1-like esterase